MSPRIVRPRPLALVAAALAVGACLTAFGASPEAADAYWSTEPGDVRVVEGTYSDDGNVVSRSRYEEVTVGKRPCGDTVCVEYSRDWKLLFPENVGASFHLDTLESLTPEQACTWQTIRDGKPTSPPGCEFVDLKGPLMLGARWDTSDTFSPIAPRLRDTTVTLAYSNTVIATDVSAKVGDDAVSGCIRVRRVAEATPEASLDCREGSSSRVTSRWNVDVTFCPGIGRVHESVTETHRKLGDPSQVCARYGADFSAVRFERSRNTR